MRLLRCLPLIGVMGLIFYLSSLPGNTLVMPEMLSFDKLLHAFAYGVLAAAALFAVPVELRRRKPRLIFLSVVFFCLLYGISDEIHQLFVPFRSSSCLDILADTAGAAIAVLLLQARQQRLMQAQQENQLEI
jgi:VanZ family protein